MSKYKIGITEAGDAGLDLSWESKLDKVDGAILVTKQITKGFHDAALRNADKIIIHATITGHGGSVIEPNVPRPKDEFDAICNLVKDGFPKEKITIRIDPIIPTERGIRVAFSVFKKFIDAGFSRFRMSLIDMYPHARERFSGAGYPLPYGERGFQPSKEQVEMADEMIRYIKRYWVKSNPKSDALRIECCAEPKLTEPIQVGCISTYDLTLLGLSDNAADSLGYQRRNCLCYSGKTELLSHKKRCGHGCLYCYWKD